MGFLERHRAFIVYNIYGFMATVLNAVLYALFYESIGLSNVLSTLLSLLVTIVFAFFTNKIRVYRSSGWDLHTLLSESLTFLFARSASSVFDLAFMYVTVDLLSLQAVTMKLISALGVGFINYFFGKHIFKSGNSK